MLEFYFSFRFLRLRYHRHVILHPHAKFRPNRAIRDRVMTSYPFFKTVAQYRNSTSGFVFPDFAHLGRSKSTCGSNCGEISQSTAEILLLPFSENKGPSCWNFTFGFDFHLCVMIGMTFCIGVQNFIRMGPSVASYDVIAIFQMAAVSHIEFSQK